MSTVDRLEPKENPTAFPTICTILVQEKTTITGSIAATSRALTVYREFSTHNNAAPFRPVRQSATLFPKEAMSGIFEQQFINRLADAIAERICRAPAGASKRLFTIPEAAEYIGRSPKAVECLIQRGTIPVTKLDGKRQVDRAALDRLISDRTFFEV